MTLHQDLEALVAGLRQDARELGRASDPKGMWNEGLLNAADRLQSILTKHAGEARDAVVEEYTQHADDSGCMTLAFTGGCPFRVGQFVIVTAMQPQPPQGGE